MRSRPAIKARPCGRGTARNRPSTRWHEDRGAARSAPAVASSGYVVHTLEAALWCVDQAGGFSEAVLLAANLAGDADTVAAVTGQIAGAVWGRTGIPAHWLERFAWREEIEAKGRRLLAAAGTNG